METKHKVSWVCIDISIMNYHYLMYHSNTYTVIESLRLEKIIKINKSNPQPNLTMPTNQVPQCHISMFLEHFQGGDSTTSLGSLCQYLTRNIAEKWKITQQRPIQKLVPFSFVEGSLHKRGVLLPECATKSCSTQYTLCRSNMILCCGQCHWISRSLLLAGCGSLFTFPFFMKYSTF